MLTADNLTVFRGNRLIFSGVSFVLRPRGILLLRGANGSGKTSLLRALAGLTPLEAGTLLWDNQPALSDRTVHATRLGWLGHQDAIKPALSLSAQVPVAALAPMGLERLADLPARFLSAGQKRRAAIARMAATPKPLWLLDEPTTGLDNNSTSRFLELCHAHCAQGGMIIASTHQELDLQDAQSLTLCAR